MFLLWPQCAALCVTCFSLTLQTMGMCDISVLFPSEPKESKTEAVAEVAERYTGRQR